MRDFTRLNAFLDRRLDDIYPEPMGEPHISIIRKMIPMMISKYDIPKGAKVLDVGCGTGIALEEFRNQGMDVTGIGFGDEAEQARNDGFEIIEKDMSFMNLEDATFDLVWCRHVMEHSLFPFFTLSEMNRILKPGGVLYMEVPAPDTAGRHEENRNHYSVLTQRMWKVLLARSGFDPISSNDINFNMPLGPDTYYAFDTPKASEAF